MFDMRFRLVELMTLAGIETAYALVQRSKEKNVHLPISTAQRLVTEGDAVKRVDLKTLRVLCDTLGIEDPGAFFSRDDEQPPPKPKASKKAR